MRIRSRSFGPTVLALVALLTLACGPAPQTEEPAAAPAVIPASTPYATPAQEIVEILDAPMPPQVVPSPDRTKLLLVDRQSMPTIEQLARPVAGLAGLRIDPANNGSATPASILGLRIVSVADGMEQPINLPDGAVVSSVDWSPDSGHVSFVVAGDEELTGWVANADTGSVQPLPLGPLNGAYGAPCEWMPDSETLLCKTIPADRRAPPDAVEPLPAPTIMSAEGPAAPVRTYQNLLRDAVDEALFDYYLTSQLVVAPVEGNGVQQLGSPGIFASVSPSATGQRLLVQRVVAPYSYLVTVGSFPREVEVWSRQGVLEQELASLSLADTVPIGGVIEGPRGFGWKPGTDDTVIYAEALDGGDSRAPASERDRVLVLAAPFDGEPVEVARTEYRYGGMTWFPDGNTALLTEFDRPSRRTRTWVVAADGAESRLLFDRSSEDRYGNPGSPVTEPLPNGQSVLRRDAAGRIFLRGAGSSPEGDRPFLDRFDLNTMQAERLFHTEEGTYETVLALLDDGAAALTRRESKTEPPNVYFRDLGNGEARPLTSYADPAPQLTGIDKQLVTYQRDDGVQLSGTLYLPPGRAEGQRVPLVMWIYPSEFNSAAAAGQVRGSPHRFTFLRGASHLFLLTQGYAILDNPSLPVIGGQVANDTYVDQTVRGAQAAIDTMVQMGITDRDTIGVGGHSYGAFATANLLAHSDLFRAGIARSGAYNRSLTPFGFQNERRTIWEATDVYVRMAPFFHADKIDEPMIMFHGQADTNSGTFPVQSDRMYHAVKGHGGTVTLVKYPHEGHGYRARESVLDCVARMIDWMDRWVRADSETTDSGA